MPAGTSTDSRSQLVENEDMIGALIETNERIIAALETYDTVSVLLMSWYHRC